MLGGQNILSAARAAAEAICQRHKHDAGAELLPAARVPQPADMAGTLDYVRSHVLRDRRLAAEDARDALVILRYLHSWADGMELAMLRLGHDSGRSWHDLATARGWRSKQAAQQRHRYLAARRATVGDGEPSVPTAAGQAEAWLARRASEIVAVSKDVAASAMPVDEARESAEVLEAELASRVPEPRVLMRWLAIVLDELKFAARLSALAEPVQGEATRLVGEWEQL